MKVRNSSAEKMIINPNTHTGSICTIGKVQGLKNVYL